MPTDAPPGSEEKMDVMAWRIKHKFSPFHPLDAPKDAESAHSRPVAAYALARGD
jgi:hypothetical protein